MLKKSNFHHRQNPFQKNMKRRMEISPSFFKNGEKLWWFLLSDPIQQITKRKGEISMFQKRKSSPYINMLIFFQFGHSKRFWEKHNGDFSILVHPIQHIAHLQKNEEILPCKTCCCFLNLERQNVFRTTKICLQSSENAPIQQFFFEFHHPKKVEKFQFSKNMAVSPCETCRQPLVFPISRV